jgi:hypothetical protein
MVKFSLGLIVATPAAIDVLEESGHMVSEFLNRHAGGDWGDCGKEDSKTNDESVAYGGRIFSVYHTKKGIKIWVITESDRSSTCVLLPDDY